MFKIASWNVNSLRVRLPHVLQWLESEQPDVLGLQELKMTDEQFPLTEINEAGYEAVFTGQKTYNGVAILSKKAGEDVLRDMPGLEDEQRRYIATTINGVRVINLYVPNGQEVGSDKYDYKLNWLDTLSTSLKSDLGQYDKIVVMGDFNIAPTDEDVHDPESWKDRILCSKPERAALQKLMDLGLSDSFRLFEQEPKLFSWWDYRAAGFRRNLGLRIDLVLCSNTLKAVCSQSYVDKAPRKLERPSDHAPAVALFNL
ncbi:MAG: exodeoxyribonuclease III [Gammaproteobacteria bacterium]|nr:exodeoxyribonuclease III [Gammaproteobacteria bacterium]MDH5694449.1 exodeoxyribonuclease III [Gammaproteobacteria bacterium]